MKLPKSNEEWMEVNHFFETMLAPAVIATSSPEEKNSILANGIYDYFVSRYGTKKAQQRRSRRSPTHKVALKTVEKQKNEAKKELREMKRRGCPAETVQAFAQKFFRLIRDHSQLKRVSQTSSQKQDAARAREQCHRNLQRFAKQILEEDNTNHIQPKFNQAAAHSFFKEVYRVGYQQFQ